MSAARSSLREHAQDLRGAFDRSFARAATERAEALVDLLAIRVGGDACAVRLRDTAGLFVDKQTAPLPSPLPELIGIAAFRGTPVPVYDLAALLGATRGARPRWILLLSGRAMGVAFEGFEGLLRVTADRIAHAGSSEREARGRREVVRAGDTVRPIVDLSAIGQLVVDRVGRAGPRKEH